MLTEGTIKYGAGAVGHTPLIKESGQVPCSRRHAFIMHKKVDNLKSTFKKTLYFSLNAAKFVLIVIFDAISYRI